MKPIPIARTLAVIAVTSVFAGCSSWHRMDKTEGTAVGAGGGAVAGAVVGGPVGAVVGGVGGAYVGHETAGKEGATTSTAYVHVDAEAFDTPAPMTRRWCVPPSRR